MRTEKHLDESELDRQLAELDENPEAPVDTTVRELHAELQTLAEQLHQPAPPNPYETEPSCQQAVGRAKSIAREFTPYFVAIPETSAEPIPASLDHFRIVRLLGQGGMGAVYLAEDTRLGREVALKTMRPELAARPGAKERFLREARLAAALEHDHIVPIYHVGEANGTPYLAMPFLKGQSLEEVLKARKTLANEQVIRLGIQVARGLAAAHERGLIHRDIKPANLWVDPKGRIKILDFGLARSSHDDIGLTQSGAILGTPTYMAPEQARGERVDGRADLYSLGVVLYRAATGKLPLHGSDTMSMLMALATETPRPACDVNPSVPPALSALITRLLAKEPSARPASAQGVLQELQGLLKPTATISAPAAIPAATLASQDPWADIDVPGGETEVESAPAQPAPDSTRRRPRRWPLVAAGLLVAFLGGGLLLQQIILRITDKDGKSRDIELKPGDRIEIVEKPTPKSDPAKTPPKNEPEIKLIAGDPDRRAAEYVLSIGGHVQINDQGQWINADSLPKEPFRLTGVNLEGNQKVTDAGLAHFKDCKALTHLHLSGTRVTDAGLAHFKDCKGLKILWLGFTKVSDVGLTQFQHCKDLLEVHLVGTQVTDAGIESFKDSTNINYLNLAGAKVTDTGLASITKIKSLERLDIELSQVTDAGLQYIKDCNLKSLSLARTQISDAGLVHLKNQTELRVLNLSYTKVTDAGLANLRECSMLEVLILNNTHITDSSLVWIAKQPLNGSYWIFRGLHVPSTRISRKGYETLKTTRPGIEIKWSEPNHDVAQTVLMAGGRVEIAFPKDENPRLVTKPDELITEYFQVRRISLEGVKNPPPEILRLLSKLCHPEFDRLESLDLTGVKQPNLRSLAYLTKLQELRLTDGCDNDSIRSIDKMPSITRLSINGSNIDFTGVQHLVKQLPNLRELSLAGCPKIDVVSCRFFSQWKNLKQLSLAKNPGWSDLIIGQLENLEQLESLDLRQTKVTAAGIERLQKALPKCKIDWDEAKK
jgi:serine/threonine protein kinase